MNIPYNQKIKIEFPNNTSIICSISEHDVLNDEHCYIIYDDGESNRPITPDENSNKFSFMKMWLMKCKITII